MAKVRLQKTRLRRLIKLLEADAKNKQGVQFDLSTVGRPSDFDQKAFSGKKVIPLNCGTTACAMGLAAISGSFKKEGLSFMVGTNSYIFPRWKRREVDYDDAAVKLFGISLTEAHYLFAPWAYPYSKRIGATAEKHVIKRIKKILEGKRIRLISY
jgi:hypothetical protein